MYTENKRKIIERESSLLSSICPALRAVVLGFRGAEEMAVLATTLTDRALE